MNLESLYNKLDAIYNALNELSVQGTRNCSIVGAIASTLENIAKELKENMNNDKPKTDDE